MKGAKIKSSPTEPAVACPFCGDYPVRRRSSDGEHWIACGTCGALGPFAKDARKALLKWNNRPAILPPPM